MKSKLGMMSMFLASAIAYDPSSNKTYREVIEPKESEEERKHRLVKVEIKRAKANGLKEFFYGGNSVWAINQKNADKKARNNNWL